MNDTAELGVIVRSLVWRADGVVGVRLECPDGETLPRWTPGAHVSIRLIPGLERQYSLCSFAEDRGYEIAVQHNPRGRGGSDYIHRFLRPGQRLAIVGPRNHFPLRPAHRYHFIAGGIGITPILPMARFADASGMSWTMDYIGRERTAMAYIDDLETLGNHATAWVSSERGRFDVDRRIGELPAETSVYVCGPESLIDAIDAGCRRRPDLSFRTERFQVSAPSPADNKPFDIVCTRSGITVHVDASTSALDALKRAGLSVHGSCREGLCGTCEVRVIEGEPEHRDHIGLADEGSPIRMMAACVSRSRSPVLSLEI